MDDALKLTIGGGVALNAVMLYSFGYAWLRRGAPFVPTAQRKLDAIFGPIGLLQSVRRRSSARHHHLICGFRKVRFFLIEN